MPMASLPAYILELLLLKVTYEELQHYRGISQDICNLIDSDEFHQLRGHARPDEAQLSIMYFFQREGTWRLAGFDLLENRWRQLPPLSYVLFPNDNEFHEHIWCTSHGLFCINVSSNYQQEQLIVVNPLTRRTRTLPHLHFCWSPSLMHMLYDPTSQSYKVIVSGSEGLGHTTRKTEVFDSATSTWTVAADIPSPLSMDLCQSGVCIGGVLYCIVFHDAEEERRVIGYDIANDTWLPSIAIPFGPADKLAFFHLVEHDGNLLLFVKESFAVESQHRFYRLDSGTQEWGAVVERSFPDTEEPPFHHCTAYGRGRVIVFKSINEIGNVYELDSATSFDVELNPRETLYAEDGTYLNLQMFSTFPSTFNPNYKSRV